jgi:hypothetical protein
VCTPALKYGDGDMEEPYDIMEEILEEDGKGAKTPSQRETVWLEINHTETLLDHKDWEAESKEVKCSSTFVK